MSHSAEADYAQFGNGNGQSFTTFDGSTYPAFTIDYVTHVSGSFTAVVGEDHITVVRPGLYLATQTVFIDDSPLAMGFLQAHTITNHATGVDFLMTSQFLCAAELTEFGNATFTMLLSVPVSGPVGLSAAQTAVDTHSLGTDCMIVRLGDLPT